MDAPTRRTGPRRWIPWLAVGILLPLLYAAALRGGGAALLDYPSGVLDMDVARVVADWTTGGPGRRVSVHPLYKLAVAPLGRTLAGRDASPARRLAAVRAITAASVALAAVLAGLLAARLAGARGPGLLAAVLCGVSFSSVLLAAIPEASSVSCLSAVPPLLWLEWRRGRPFTFGEAAVWGGLGVLGIGLTITQVGFFAIALACRCLAVARGSGGVRGARLATRVLLALALAVSVTWGAASLQTKLYPGTPRFYEEGPQEERSWLRLSDLAEEPIAHVSRVVSHFLFYDFVAPFPGYSHYLIDFYAGSRPEYRYWSLSIEEAGFEGWRPAQLALAGGLALLLAAAAVGLRRPDPRFAAPLLCLGYQLALHILYGREYVLYSGNWHGVLCAIVVAAAFRAAGARRRALAGLTAALCLGIFVNSWIVLDRVYAEVERGLDRHLRDSAGRPIEPLAR